MKSLSDKLMILMLAAVLGLSPLQNIAASVSNCMGMGNTMSHQMNMSDKSALSDMKQSDSKHDCCKQNGCGTLHCSGGISAVLASNYINDMTYTVSSIYSNPVVSLISFYPSSLYRPPKI